MRELFQKILFENRLLQDGDRVLVAVSGGPDSVALLDLLRDVASDVSIALFAAHLDHGMRAESGDDLAFVEKLCSDWDIPLSVKRVDVPLAARRKGKGLEETAREVRRDCLKAAAREWNCNVIALGHHQGDQAETLVHRLIRGVGPSGLAAMKLRDGEVIRPLLPFSRRQILEYLGNRKLSYVVDQSNFDTRFTRNRIRHEVLPLLESFNPQLEKQLFQLSQMVTEEESYWVEQETAVLDDVILERDEGLWLDAVRLRKVHPALRKRVIRRCLETVRGDQAGLTYAQIVAADELLFSSRPHAELNLMECWVGRNYDKLHIRRQRPSVPEPFCFELNGEGVVEIPGMGRFQAGLADRLAEENRWCVEFDADQVRFPLIVRSFQPGDSFQPAGMKGNKKVKDFFIDRKVDRAWRLRIPLVAAEKIIWVVSMRRSELYRPSACTEKVLKLTFKPEKAFKNLSL
jgi:tRNA(Ile)-lysidine synthase